MARHGNVPTWSCRGSPPTTMVSTSASTPILDAISNSPTASPALDLSFGGVEEVGQTRDPTSTSKAPVLTLETSVFLNKERPLEIIFSLASQATSRPFRVFTPLTPKLDPRLCGLKLGRVSAILGLVARGGPHFRWPPMIRPSLKTGHARRFHPPRRYPQWWSLRLRPSQPSCPPLPLARWRLISLRHHSSA